MMKQSGLPELKFIVNVHGSPLIFCFGYNSEGPLPVLTFSVVITHSQPSRMFAQVWYIHECT